VIPVHVVADCRVAVLGGTAGVGLETASQFAEQGARVVLLGRDDERGAAACEKIGLRAPLGDARFIRVDATDPDDTVRAEQECRSADTPGAALIGSDPFSAKMFEKAVAMAHLGVASPADLASMTLFLASPAASRITGQTISINGGISVG
jgi:NAD(P)-dependent dehydrogenase (short-subunit alcohol dehydrogenase family)